MDELENKSKIIEKKDGVNTSKKKNFQDVESEEYIEKLFTEDVGNSDLFNTPSFDKTLKEINLNIKNLENKLNDVWGEVDQHDLLPAVKSVVSKISNVKNELINEENNLIKNNNLIIRVEKIEKNIDKIEDLILESNESKLNMSNITEDHIIDLNNLSAEENHQLKDSSKNQNNSFSFYAYLMFLITTLIAIFVIINFSKNIIISNYPGSEVYINYFYEVSEIIKITIFDLVGPILKQFY